MTFAAFLLERTAVLIINDKVCGLPIGAGQRIILKRLRFPSVILPVMRVNAERLIVLGEIEWTPDSLEVEHVEVIIVFEVMDEIYRDIVLVMSKRAERPVLTKLETVRIMTTEFRFVFLRLVQLLDSVVGFEAHLTIRAVFGVLSVFAKIRRIEVTWTFTVFQVVVERALLMVMLSVMGARL